MVQTGIEAGSCWKPFKEDTPAGSMMRVFNFNGNYDLGIFLGWMKYDLKEHDYVKCGEHDFINGVDTIYAAYVLYENVTRLNLSYYNDDLFRSEYEFYSIEK